ncbi:MAG: hypothetical protein IJM90_01505 [Firmicutes bacterium]|nr:hypothetical protein [Bacillota bacterium]
MKQNEQYLAIAAPEYRAMYDAWKAGLTEDWAGLQKAFIRMTKDYLDKEIQKPLEIHIDSHEAGGQFRIAFPYQTIRSDEKLAKYMKDIVETRKAYTDANQYHGYVDCHEVHHEIETYIYFQNPLYYYGLPGAETAAGNIVDVAHHTGNWVEGVPDWYNWQTHGFVSNYLGTRGVRNYPPHDYQEGNHFRFIDEAICAYKITGEEKYLDLVKDYCDRWCEHIETLAAAGGPIPCSILPEQVQAKEMSRAGVFQETQYTIFYSTVADNTMYDIVSGLLDAYRLTGRDRYLRAAETMMEQFWVNGRDGRPAIQYKDGEWRVQDGTGREGDRGFVTDCTYLARLALRYHQITGEPKYRDRVLAWARSCDEENKKGDQVMANVFFAAHFYDGDPRWLARAYEELLKMGAVCEADDQFHQCAWSFTRQGGRFLMEYGFQPITGCSEWATRGSMPQEILRHVTDGKLYLDPAISFRLWWKEGNTYCYEAVNSANTAKTWDIQTWEGRPVTTVTVPAGGSTCGEFTL